MAASVIIGMGSTPYRRSDRRIGKRWCVRSGCGRRDGFDLVESEHGGNVEGKTLQPTAWSGAAVTRGVGNRDFDAGIAGPASDLRRLASHGVEIVGEHLERNHAGEILVAGHAGLSHQGRIGCEPVDKAKPSCLDHSSRFGAVLEKLHSQVLEVLAP